MRHERESDLPDSATNSTAEENPQGFDLDRVLGEVLRRASQQHALPSTILDEMMAGGELTEPQRAAVAAKIVVYLQEERQSLQEEIDRLLSPSRDAGEE